MNHYQVLGVPATASSAEIKNAYLVRARKCHPDRNPGDKAAKEQFKTIQEAYDVLSHPKKRQMYDCSVAAQEAELELVRARAYAEQADLKAAMRDRPARTGFYQYGTFMG